MDRPFWRNFFLLLNARADLAQKGEEMADVISYYNSIDEGHRLNRNYSRRLEFYTTRKYILENIKQGDVVADIGAGEGVYTFEIADKCSKAVAFDIVPKHIEKINQIKQEKNSTNIEAVQTSILDIDKKYDSSFDVVLCLGPYYHLRKKQERLASLKKCYDLLKPNGTLLISYLNRYASVSTFYKFSKFPSKEMLDEWQKDEYTKEFGFDNFMDISFCSDPEMTENELKLCNFQIEKNIGTDGMFSLVTKQMESMTEEDFENLLDFHLKNCEDRHLIGMNNHGLIICKKR